jgi:predicted nucleotidyltransferase
MQKTLSTERKKAIKDRISTILSAQDDLICAYLFGSFAEADTFSDVDIGVLLSNPVTPAEALRLEMALEEAISSENRIPTDVRILNGAPVPFVYQVIRNSILILDKKPRQRAEFESRIFTRYFDFQPYRNRYLREIADAPL